MKELDTLALIWCIAVVAIMGVFMLHDSSSIIDTSYSTPSTASTPSGSYESYELEHNVKGYLGSVTEVTDYTLTDEQKQEIFDEYRQQEDWEAAYDEARWMFDDEREDSFQEEEEDRIEEYCDEEGYMSCYNIQYTCDGYYCYLVTIICEDGDYSPTKEMQWGKKYGCDEWDVTVDDDSFDIRDVHPSYYEDYGYQS
jgi:hypothetical protein